MSQDDIPDISYYLIFWKRRIWIFHLNYARVSFIKVLAWVSVRVFQQPHQFLTPDRISARSIPITACSQRIAWWGWNNPAQLGLMPRLSAYVNWQTATAFSRACVGGRIKCRARINTRTKSDARDTKWRSWRGSSQHDDDGGGSSFTSTWRVVANERIRRVRPRPTCIWVKPAAWCLICG